MLLISVNTIHDSPYSNEVLLYFLSDINSDTMNCYAFNTILYEDKTCIIHACTHKHTHTCMCTHTNTRTRTHTCTHKCACALTYTHKYMCAHTHTHTHKCTCTQPDKKESSASYST